MVRGPVAPQTSIDRIRTKPSDLTAIETPIRARFHPTARWSRIRILALAPSLNPTSGWATIPANVLPELARDHEVTALVGEATDPQYKDRYDFAVDHVLPSTDRASHPVYTLRLGLSLRKRLQDVDVVHSFITYPYLPAAAIAAIGRDVTLTATGLGTYAVQPLQMRWRRPLLSFGYRRADHVFFTSDYTESRVLEELDLTNTSVQIAAGVDLDRFGTEPPRDEGYILSVGAIKKRKAQDVLTEAFARIADEFPEIDLVLVGSVQHEEINTRIDEVIAEHDLTDRVRRPGLVSDRDQLAELYRDCTIFSLTPRVVEDNFEGGPVVFFEAGAFSKASLTTDAGGAATAVLHDETGLVVESENVDAVADGLRRLLGDEDLRRRLGEGARERVESSTWQTYAEALVEQWNQLDAGK